MVRLRIAHALAIFSLLVVALLARPVYALGPNAGLSPDASIDRSTPKLTVDGFLRAGDFGDFSRAAHYLDLRAVPRQAQAKEGPAAAEQLWYVLRHAPRVELEKVPDDAAAAAKDDTPLDVGTIYVEDDAVPFTVVRVKFDDGVSRWVIARSTVAVGPMLYQTLGPRPWEQRIPPPLRRKLAGNEAWQWLALLAVVPVAYLLARALAAFVVLVLRALARRTQTKADDVLVDTLRSPLRLAFTAVLIDASSNPLSLTRALEDALDHVEYTLLVVAGTWFAIGATRAASQWFEERLPDEALPGADRRGARTRLLMFERVAAILLVFIGLALALVQFDAVRAVGVSLLASAGLAGVVFGFAAQKSLGAIVAGVQLSVTQPIRLGDSVVLEGEFGTVEHISLTYVILKLWDERRMIAPVTRFLEQPFQNWSKVSAQLTGAVTLMCDYGTPVARVREELTRVCKGSKNWDGRTCSLQVTDVNERSMTLRALVSASDPSTCWDLRCEVRERLVELLRTLDGGRHLSRARTETFDLPRTDGAPS